MSRTANCIKMLQMLNSGRIIKISEFAEEFETNPRNIIEYRKELEDAGYSIITIPGKDGGYKLHKEDLFPTLKLSGEEKDALNECFSFVLKQKDFTKKKELFKAMGKVCSNYYSNSDGQDVIVIDRFPLAMPEEEIRNRYLAVEYCIHNKKPIEIEYLSLKNTVKKQIVDPYLLYNYNNAWFMLCWHEKYNDICYYKLNRIQSFQVLNNKKFAVYKYFNPSDYLDSFGMKNNGEFYHVKFIATGPYASLVKERIYGKNQVVTSIDETSTMVEVDMQNKENILVFILGFNKNIKVLEPKWLIDELKDFKEYLSNLY